MRRQRHVTSVCARQPSFIIQRCALSLRTCASGERARCEAEARDRRVELALQVGGCRGPAVVGACARDSKQSESYSVQAGANANLSIVSAGVVITARSLARTSQSVARQRLPQPARRERLRAVHQRRQRPRRVREPHRRDPVAPGLLDLPIVGREQQHRDRRRGRPGAAAAGAGSRGDGPPDLILVQGGDVHDLQIDLRAPGGRERGH